jgi:amidase
MPITDYAKYDGLGLAALVAKKKVTPMELVDEAIARAERLNPKLNAIIYKNYENARARAKGKLRGPFAGVPFLLKDIFGLTTTMPTRQASKFMPPIPGMRNAVLVDRFLTAGLVPFGKTNVPEFGLVATTESKLYGPAHNPWKLDHSTGGSSGGSAAAVAAGIVPLAHANDGGGSIRIPASACGLVGLKPTRGRITNAPDFGDVLDGLAIDLVVSRSVRDTAAALDATAGPVMGDPYWAPAQPDSYLNAMKRKPKKLRIGFAAKRLDGGAFHPDCLAAVKHAAKICGDLGHDVEEASPNLDQALLIPAFMALWGASLAHGIDTIATLTGQTPTDKDFEGTTWGLYEQGKQISASQYIGAKAMLQMAGRQAAQFHETYDMWLTPTLGKPPVKLGTFDMDERDVAKSFGAQIDYVPFTAMQNATGQPAINLPLYWNKENLPIGVQFVGRFGDEETLLKLAASIEKTAPWAGRYASVEAQ